MPKIIKSCTPEELKVWCSEQWGRLKQYLTEAIVHLPPENHAVLFDDNELIATLLGGAVTVQPTIYEVRSIRGIEEKPGWGITSWKHEAETEYAPADFVPSEEKTTSQTIGASVIAVKMAFDVLLEDWGSRKNDDEYAAQLKEEGSIQ